MAGGAPAVRDSGPAREGKSLIARSPGPSGDILPLREGTGISKPPAPFGSESTECLYSAQAPSRGWDTANEATQSTNGLPPSRCSVWISPGYHRNVGLPTGGDPEGNGVPIGVVGVTPHQGGRESRPQGQGGQVALMQTDGEVCAMQDATTVHRISRDSAS
jgi:hypothetical protein